MIDIILNPASHGFEGRQVWDQLEKILTDEYGWLSGRDFALHETTEAHSAEAIARELTAAPDHVPFLAVIGGDGTLDEVANGLPEDQTVRLAVFPSGSGNDFVRANRLTHDIRTFAAALAHPQHFKRVDLGEVTADEDPSTTRRFIVSSGIGYDASVCFIVASARVKKLVRRLKLQSIQYTVSGVREIFRTPPMTGTFTAGGRVIRLENARFVSAHVHPYEGGGYKFAPKADASDGKLDFCIVNRCSTGKFFCVLAASLLHLHTHLKNVVTVRAESAELQFTQAFPAHRDGELYGHRRKLSYRCRKSELYLLKT